MKLATKLVVGLVGLVVIGSYLAANKAKKLMAIFEKMTISPAGVSNINISFDRIKFNLDIKLTNPTAESFDFSTYGIVDLKAIHIFYDGKYIATSQLNLVDIFIPSNDTLIINDIPVEVPKPLTFVANNLPLIQSMITGFNVNKVTTTLIIDVAGTTIEV